MRKGKHNIRATVYCKDAGTYEQKYGYVYDIYCTPVNRESFFEKQGR